MTAVYIVLIFGGFLCIMNWTSLYAIYIKKQRVSVTPFLGGIMLTVAVTTLHPMPS